MSTTSGFQESLATSTGFTKPTASSNTVASSLAQTIVTITEANRKSKKKTILFIALAVVLLALLLVPLALKARTKKVAPGFPPPEGLESLSKEALDRFLKIRHFMEQNSGLTFAFFPAYGRIVSYFRMERVNIEAFKDSEDITPSDVRLYREVMVYLISKEGGATGIFPVVDPKTEKRRRQAKKSMFWEKQERKKDKKTDAGASTTPGRRELFFIVDWTNASPEGTQTPTLKDFILAMQSPSNIPVPAPHSFDLIQPIVVATSKSVRTQVKKQQTGEGVSPIILVRSAAELKTKVPALTSNFLPKPLEGDGRFESNDTRSIVEQSLEKLSRTES